MITWEYLAGFLDGDGWITHSKNNNCSTNRHTIGFTQIYRERKNMSKIFKFLKYHGINCCMFDRESIGSINKITKMINIQISSQNSVLKLAIKLHPHLLIKKDRFWECIEYLTDIKEKRGIGIKIPKGKKFWTEKEERILLTMNQDGYAHGAISDKLGRTTYSVSQKFSQLKNYDKLREKQKQEKVDNKLKSTWDIK